MQRREFMSLPALAAGHAKPDPRERYNEAVTLWTVGGFSFYATASQCNGIYGQFIYRGGSNLAPFEAFQLVAELTLEAGLR